MEKESLKILYQDGDTIISETESGYYLHIGELVYELACHYYEPCLYIMGEGDNCVTIHDAFTVDHLSRLAESKGTLKMITNDEYDLQGICKLLCKAVSLMMNRVYVKFMNISYLEGCCFLDYLEECGAISKDTAVPLTNTQIKNPKVIESFQHLNKRVNRTDDARYYVSKI